MHEKDIFGIYDINNEEIKEGDFFQETGEFADPRKFQLVRYTRLGVMDEDGRIVTNFPLFSESHMAHYKIVK